MSKIAAEVERVVAARIKILDWLEQPNMRLETNTDPIIYPAQEDAKQDESKIPLTPEQVLCIVQKLCDDGSGPESITDSDFVEIILPLVELIESHHGIGDNK